MSWTTWWLYAAAVVVLIATPGPSVLLAVSTAIQHGPRRALIASAGSTTAIGAIMVLSMLGLGSVLAASESGFLALKWLGAAYLAYLGISALRSPAAQIQVPTAGGAKPPVPVRARSLYLKGLLVGASNPKALLFFTALFPQFIDPLQPQAPQFVVLGLTFVAFELAGLAAYAFSAARASRWLQAPRRARQFNRGTGVVFLLAAALVAVSKKPG
jgi:threonine/homoserine/homoserine lactone efflux protein